MGDTGSGYQLSAKDLAKSHQAGESIRKYADKTEGIETSD